MNKIILFSYVLILFLFSAFSYAFVDVNLLHLKNLYSGFGTQSRLFSTLIYIFFISILFCYYAFFLYLWKNKKIKLKEIKIYILIICFAFFLAYPAMLSYDIFNYMLSAKVLFYYHENPYVIMPIEFLGDYFLNFTHAANKIALYGPIWIAVSGIPHFLGFDNFIATIATFKLFITIFYLGTCILVWKLTRNLLSLIFFAFNPLIIIETLMSSHNDIVMMFFVLLSYFFIKRKKIILSIIFFVFSIFIKYASFVLFPVFLYILWSLYKSKKIIWEKVYFYSTIMMYIVFSLSPLREEVYSWYGIWFLTFVAFLPAKNIIVKISLAFSISLLLRYIPFMYIGTYFNQTPLLKTIFTFSLPFFTFCMFFLKDNLWKKHYFR